jgi:predicted MFS family arabinose efflux permease
VQRAPAMTRGLAVLMAFCAGSLVANLYYAQPLLATLASSLNTSDAAAGLLVTVLQFGYAAGLLLVVPLGDYRERRKLLTVLISVCVCGLAASVFAPTVATLAVTFAVVGIAACAAQVIVALAGDLAGDRERGTVLGTVMTGMIVGMVLARASSGVLADAVGWRAVYGTSAALVGGLGLAFRRRLPVIPAAAVASYASIMRSVGSLVASQPLLRRRMVYGALAMTAYSALWTSLTFLLNSDAYNYSDATIGLFGLLGIVGALATRMVGRLNDRGWGNRITGLGWLSIGVGWTLCLAGSTVLPALVVGVVCIDAGSQAVFVTNATIILGIGAGARSRLTTAYMTGNFLFAAIGSATAAAVWDAGGWSHLVIVALAVAGVGLAVWCGEQLSARAAGQAGGA